MRRSAMQVAAVVLCGAVAAAQEAVPQAPWSANVEATRAAALDAGTPCVLVLNSDARAL